jgi:tetratricopeptide (TPR) repeat protein
MIHALLLSWLALQGARAGAAQHLRQGLDARKRGQLDTAIVEFREATELDPNLSEAFVDLGETYMEKPDYGAAIAPLRQALVLKPDLARAHQLLGHALVAQGYAAKAIPHLERVGDKGALGIAQIETGQLPEAVANLSVALAERPDDPDLLYYLGRASNLLWRHAIDTLQTAHPDSARSHQAMAENFLMLRRLPQAEEEYQEALRLGPATPKLHLELGQLYATASQWTKAEREFRAESKLQPGSAEAAYRLGATLLEEGKTHEALVELRGADRLRPDIPETLYSLGKAALLDGDAASAVKAWKKVIELVGQSSLTAQAHFELANLYRKQGDKAQAQHEMLEYQKLQDLVR